MILRLFSSECIASVFYSYEKFPLPRVCVYPQIVENLSFVMIIFSSGLKLFYLIVEYWVFPLFPVQ